MKLFKKENKIMDERITNTINKIYKEAYFLAMIISLISIVVKYSLYGVNVRLVITEILIIFVPCLYYLIRIVRLGIYLDEIEVHDRTNKISMSTKKIIVGLVLGVAIAVFFGLRSSILYGNDSNRLWYFIIVFFVSIGIYIPFFVSIIVFTDAVSRKASKKAHPEEE